MACPRRGRRAGESGVAVVEFALVSALALVVALALVQLALYLFQRNAVLTAVAEGARVGAAAGRDAEAGRVAACTLIRQSTGDPCRRVRVVAGEREGQVGVSASGGRGGRAAGGSLRGFVPRVPDLPVRLSARMHDEEDLVGGPPGGAGGRGGP